MASSSDQRARPSGLPAPPRREAEAAPDWIGADLLNQLPDGVILADAEGRIVFVNDAAAQLHGGKRLGVGPEAYGEAYRLFTLDGRPFPAADLPLARAVRGETVVDARWCIRRGDGGELVAIGSARPFLDSEGRQRGALLTLRDDSARHRAELAVAESEARFRTIADCAPSPVWVTGRDGVEFVNRAYVEMAGLPEAALLGHAWMSHFHKEDMVEIAAARDAAWASGAPYSWEARFRRASGEWRWIRASCAPRFDAAGAVAGYVGMAVDVTESHRAEEALRRREALLQAMFDHAGVGMVLMDKACTIARSNAAFSEITGRSEAELLGSDCLGITHPDDLPVQRALLASLTAESGPAAFEKRYVHRDGPDIWVRMTLSMVGEQVLAVVEDVTARKTAELHLRLMVDELNHRVKNTLAIVQGLAQQSFRGAEVPAESRRSFEGRLSALATAHNLLTQSSWEAAELGAIVREILFAHGRDRFAVEGPPVRLPPKTAVSLAMALHELATNAVKYGALSAPSGSVAIRWRVAGEDRLLLDWDERGGPPVAPPSKRGFGTRMIERALDGEAGGGATLEFRREGVRCRISAALPGIVGEEQEADGSEGYSGPGGGGRAGGGDAARGHAP
ncbi:MAG: PAS domain S-box protein [Alphaproteobacteria bacterium]|nr:PAS domain S-box protein [Alphaproteobacteria bacterium]MBV9371678.1 PAS domain S-box protein [Alphaproteobacteria bacterium]MBV9902454.1 PAS domain S-box protein [Alphaproteobacteria bacterium]